MERSRRTPNPLRTLSSTMTERGSESCFDPDIHTSDTKLTRVAWAVRRRLTVVVIGAKAQLRHHAVDGLVQRADVQVDRLRSKIL